MSKVVVDVSMSLDGFVSGPNVRDDEPMGDGGENLHGWMGDAAEAKQRVDATNVGATVVGRRTFDLGLRPWGGTPWPGVPSFVVTHRPRPDLRGDNGGTFAFGDLRDAVSRAKQAAGDKDVFVLGADISRQMLETGLLDELWIHITPILLGGGTPLFAGNQAKLIQDGQAIPGSSTHLRFRVARS
jgi:dihydrofolate reductase